jgi:hypothetical protein
MNLLDKTMFAALTVCTCAFAAPAQAQNAEASTDPSPDAATKDGRAQHECFDFAKVTPLDAEHATITIHDYGTGAPPESRGVSITGTKLAGGTAPELRTHRVTAQVVPKKPVKKVRLNIAEASSGGAAPHANIEVNGEKHEVTGGLATINGEVIGKAPAGSAEILVNLAPATAGNWNVGTLELHAIKGEIESFGFGGLQVFVDNVCFVK